jgi:hypothetical protein
LSIELNPTIWGSLENIRATLNKFVDINALEVARIDHAVDIEIPVGILRKCLRVKYKRGWKMYKEMIEGMGKEDNGFYLGKIPEIYNIYNKKADLRRKGLETPVAENLSRIELRQTKKKVAINYLRDFETLIDYDPFKNIEFIEFSDPYPLMKSEEISLMLEESCMAQVYSKLNSNNNFKRNFKNRIKSNDLAKDLTSIYKENLGHFLTLLRSDYGKA